GNLSDQYRWRSGGPVLCHGAGHACPCARNPWNLHRHRRPNQRNSGALTMDAGFKSRFDATETLLRKVFESGQPVFISFSGGKDSLAVLKLCEPWRGRFRLLWVNTGYAFPHMEEMIRAH